MISINLFDFQEECSDYITNYCLNDDINKTLIVKSPTGSGKTIILLDFIEKYINIKTEKICFVWLTPGSGDLEEQSKNKMNKHLPNFISKDIDDILNEGFEDNDVCFINWERVTKRGNVAIAESERKNLFEHISKAHRSQINFILIIDEEHSNNTSRASNIIDAFSPIYTIRVSATAQRNQLHDFYQIDENRVINSGLITKSLYINENLNETRIEDENKVLIDLALEKRNLISEEYSKINEDINPLIIIQFPNESPELIESIEEILLEKGITYDNGFLAIRMSDNHCNFENIEENDNIVQVLLIKQAVATGWDCPRAKILIKLRENMDEQFEIQTLGRLRRMPKAKHYDNPILDNAYLYTFDERYANEVRQSIEFSYLVKRIFLKEEFSNFTLTKQLRNLDYVGVGERETYENLYKFLIEKYCLEGNFDANIITFESKGYKFGEGIQRDVVIDQIYETDQLLSNEDLIRKRMYFDININQHSITLMQTIDSFKSIIGLNYEKTKLILERLFRNNNRYQKKLISLNTEEYYSFIINNKDNLKTEFREFMSEKTKQEEFVVNAKTAVFKFPEQEIFKYSKERDIEILTKNVYKDYSDDCLVEGIRSKSERLFERFCQNNDNIKWFYKNGDSGQTYFSVVYLDGFRNQHLFYADYILSTIDDKIWIIETKGGESQGIDRNIDINVKNKFNAFKYYAEKYEINWGFVRDKNEKLYLNNTEYVDDMNDENWKLLSEVF